MWYRYKTRYAHKQTKTEDPNISIHYYKHFMFNKRSKTYTTAPTNGAGKTRCPHAEEFRFVFPTLHKNDLQVDLRPPSET